DLAAASEHQPHLDGVPELTARAPVLLDATAFLDEAELPVELDSGGVVREDAKAELVQTVAVCPLDRGNQERRADAASAPLARDGHSDLSEAVPTRLDVQQADELRSGDSDDCPVDRPACRARIAVNGLLCRGPGGLLRALRQPRRTRTTD